MPGRGAASARLELCARVDLVGPRTEIGISEANGVTVVELRGELDSPAADELRQALSGLLDQGRARLIVDLEGVPHVESRGLGALVAALQRARAMGGDLKLCALRREVRSIFGITHLNKVIPVFPTRQEALASWVTPEP